MLSFFSLYGLEAKTDMQELTAATTDAAPAHDSFYATAK